MTRQARVGGGVAAWWLVSLLMMLWVAGGRVQAADEAPSASVPVVVDGFEEISWDALVPADWHPEALFSDDELAMIDDADPRVPELMARLRAQWDAAPVVHGMEGRAVRIPGFVVPLDSRPDAIGEFLLVPYFGACIHVPPPPANQLIHVLPDADIDAELNMMPVWVHGRMSIQRVNSDLGVAGYQLKASHVEPYREPLPAS